MGVGEAQGITIGAVSRATGIPTNTLRTWERRYGFPTPGRSPSGQRLYEPALVEHLRLVSRALSLGHRPAQVVPAPLSHVRRLLGESFQEVPAPTPLVSSDDTVAEWVGYTRDLDASALERGFAAEATRLGGFGFLTERASPFLYEVGEQWARGSLAMYQEHFASERLRSFLSNMWRTLVDRANGPIALLATLSGERHDLGLHMVATGCAIENWRVVFVGPDTPVNEVVDASRKSRARVVMIGVSPFAEPGRTRADLVALRARLDTDIKLLVGGAGAPVGIDGVEHMEDLDALREWLRRQV